MINNMKYITHQSASTSLSQLRRVSDVEVRLKANMVSYLLVYMQSSRLKGDYLPKPVYRYYRADYYRAGSLTPFASKAACLSMQVPQWPHGLSPPS